MWIDARVPVRFGVLSDARDGDAVLLPMGTPAPEGVPAAWLPGQQAGAPLRHPPGCACCVPRNTAAQALGELYLRRGRGEVAAFRSVLAVVAGGGMDLVRTALATDPLVSGRFVLAPGTPP